MYRYIELFGAKHPVVGLLIAIGIAISIFLLSSLSEKKNWFTFSTVLIIILWNACAYAVGGRVGQWIFYEHLADFKILQGGSSFLGGVSFIVITTPILARLTGKDIRLISDFSIYGLNFVQIFGKLGCFFAGCCYGRPSDVAWAIRFPKDSYALPFNVGLHPTQLYELIAIIFIFVIINRVIWGQFKTGSVTSIYLILYGVERFLVEFYRGDTVQGFFTLTSGQVVALVITLLGLLLQMQLWHNVKREIKNKFVV